MTPRAIDIRIDELVLHGVGSLERLRVGAALEAELARLLAERGAPALFAVGRQAATAGGRSKPRRGFDAIHARARPQTLDAIDGGSFTWEPHASPAALGHQVARAIYAGLDT
jgi:uncharacterized small protein (DUF1192 family)